MTLVKITLKHNLGLFILSFETMNLGPHYVPKKSILIERGYLDWRVFFLEKFFIINKAVVSFPQPKILINHSLDRKEFLNFWVHNKTIEKWKKKKCDSRVKTRKGSLEQKRENSQRLISEANKRMKGQRSDSIRSLYEVLYTFSKKTWTFLFQNAFPWILESITVGFEACQIAIFRD